MQKLMMFFLLLASSIAWANSGVIVVNKISIDKKFAEDNGVDNQVLLFLKDTGFKSNNQNPPIVISLKEDQSSLINDFRHDIFVPEDSSQALTFHLYKKNGLLDLIRFTKYDKNYGAITYLGSCKIESGDQELECAPSDDANPSKPFSIKFNRHTTP